MAYLTLHNQMKADQLRGRPYVDLAIRVRHWGWYSLVREESGLSDNALDERYKSFDSESRPRYFTRIRREGALPKHLIQHSTRPSLVERIHQSGDHPRAKKWFESKLWELLIAPDVSSEHVRRIIETESRRLDLRPVLKPLDPPGFGLFDAKSLIRSLVAMPDINGLTLLCALFRDAYLDFEIDLARQLKDAIKAACERSLRAMPTHGTHRWKECLIQLISDRIFHNRYITELLWSEAEASQANASRVVEIRSYIDWYLSPDNPVRRRNSVSMRWSRSMRFVRHNRYPVDATSFRPDYMLGEHS